MSFANGFANGPSSTRFDSPNPQWAQARATAVAARRIQNPTGHPSTTQRSAFSQKRNGRGIHAGTRCKPQSICGCSSRSLILGGGVPKTPSGAPQDMSMHHRSASVAAILALAALSGCSHQSAASTRPAQDVDSSAAAEAPPTATTPRPFTVDARSTTDTAATAGQHRPQPRSRARGRRGRDPRPSDPRWAQGLRNGWV